ncbi:uncharacterized protein L201_002949 [Kwoniella dendrophila CBS 6074]|uniref:Uncharacterized protein n=1 Tax=Kwoniella dendrophila CBS 6074 TaxID=1295534 RepID=A0AAX4JRL6_9TREE
MISETPLSSRSSRSSSSASTSSSSSPISSSSITNTPTMIPTNTSYKPLYISTTSSSNSSSPIFFEKDKLPSPVTMSPRSPGPFSFTSSTKNKPTKRKFKIVLLQILSLCILVYWMNDVRLRLTHMISTKDSVLGDLMEQSSSVMGLQDNLDTENQIAQLKNGIPQKKEAYVTFLSSISDINYLLSTRLLIYQVLHDPTTSDSTRQRDFVVITTPEIDSETDDLLKREGAKVEKVDLLKGFELSNDIQNDKNHHWKDQYTKLNIFNLVKYDKILYLDNDILLLNSLENIWQSKEVIQQGGFQIGGIGENNKKFITNTDLRLEPSKNEIRDYLNAGFMLIKPSTSLFQSLLKVKGYDNFYMEQALINHYFDWNGKQPWTPLNPKFVSHYPKASDVEEGYHALHAKMWKDPVDETVKQLWREAVTRMDDYWTSRRQE